MTWNTFVDPIIYKKKNKSDSDRLPVIYKGKVLEIVNRNTIVVKAKPAQYIISYKHFFIKLKTSDISDKLNSYSDEYVDTNEIQSCWKRYNSTDYLKDTLLYKNVKLENLEYDEYKQLSADIYLGDIHINQRLLECGFSHNKKVKFMC
jgi:hypothetical protein